jgi:hypothetical protein
MACSCTEDKEVLPGGIIIGRNRVMCQECIDNNAKAEKERQKQDLVGQLNTLEAKSLRKLFDGEDLTDINAQRLALRNQIQGL